MGRAFALLASGGLLLVMTAILRPGDLMGSAPRTADWNSGARDVRVVDGETLHLGDRVLRLYGVDAPARGEACIGRVDCGGMAAAELAGLVRDRALECQIHGRDSFGRGLGICRAGGIEVNASMVASGWARAEASAVPSLAPLEAIARLARRGMWAEIPR